MGRPRLGLLAPARTSLRAFSRGTSKAAIACKPSGTVSERNDLSILLTTFLPWSFLRSDARLTGSVRSAKGGLHAGLQFRVTESLRGGGQCDPRNRKCRQGIRIAFAEVVQPAVLPSSVTMVWTADKGNSHFRETAPQGHFFGDFAPKKPSTYQMKCLYKKQRLFQAQRTPRKNLNLCGVCG